MKKRFHIHSLRSFVMIAAYFFIISMISAQYSPHPEIEGGKVYKISPQSILSITGSTNVNQFNCSCTEPMPAQIFYIDELDDEHCTTIFRETFLSLRIQSLDCGNKMMNKDMYKALNASVHPNISIELLQVSLEKCDLSGTGNVTDRYAALTRITLNGRSRDYWMKITARETAPDQFHLVGGKSLCMSDFGITPPTAALGMVKVKDEIRISLDMKVEVE